MDRESRRWPDHRKIEEKRITDLEQEVATLRARIATLEAKLREQRAPSPVEVAAPPAPESP